MTPADTQVPRAPQAIERFVKQLNVAFKAVRLYPLASQIPQDAARASVELLRIALEREPVVQITVAKEGLFFEGGAIFPESEAFAGFAKEFYSRNLAEVRFHAGCLADDILRFLDILDTDPDTILAAGGFEAGLWERSVDNVTVTEVSARIVEHEAGEGGTETPEEFVGEQWPPEPVRVDEIVAGAAMGRPRDQRLLVRIIRDPAVLSDYFVESLEDRGVKPDEGELASRITGIAHAVQFELPDEQETLLRGVADAIMTLDPDLRSRLVRTRLLEESRLDDMVAEVVRQMSLDELFDSILQDMRDTPESRAGLARAIRNLAMINVAQSREGLMEAAATSMRARGASESLVAAVMQDAAPQKLQVNESTRSSGSEPVENILRLIDLSPERARSYTYDEEVADLRAEAAKGITDGDVLSSLVAIAVLDKRPEQFGSIMSLLEDSIGLLADLQEWAVAADAAEALSAAEKDPELTEAQQRRVREVLALLAKPNAMKQIVAALRVYRHDSPESLACRRLLGVLGEHTLDPLLEVLAQEQDMQARKALVDLLSNMAGEFIEELGGRLSDPRWYFVRNVVNIMGSTRDPRVAPMLQRTIRHGDARVRRETIRALANVRGALSDELLVSALQDDDAQNVQLAARYLGSVGVRGAAPALEQAARGEGRGNRDNAARIEAIEALGRLGAASSMPVLQELAKTKSGLLAGRKDKDIKTAAEAAIGALRANRTRGGGAEQ